MIVRRVISILIPAVLVMAFAYMLLDIKGVLDVFGVEMTEESGTIARRIVGAALGVAIAWLCFRLLDVCLWWAIVERRAGRPAPRLLVAILRVGVSIVVVCLIVAYVFDQPLTGLLVSSGVVGIVLGFALQKTISDFFSGIALNVERSFSIGDWIELDGVTGKVVEINWRATHLTTLDKVTVVVPNSFIAEHRMLNYSTPRASFRAHVTVALEYGVPVPDAKRVLLAAVRSVPGVLDRPSPDVMVTSFGADGIDYDIRFYVEDYEALTPMIDAVAATVNHHLFQAGLSVPFPKRDVYYAPMPPRELDRRSDRGVLLGRVDLFDGLDDECRSHLAECLNECRFKAGDRIVRQGEAGSTLFLVVDGLLDVRVDDGDRSRTVARIEPGGFFGEMSLLTGEPRAATVVAVVDATLYELDQESMAPIIQNRPQIAESLSRMLAERKTAIDAGRTGDTSTQPADARSTSAELLRKIQRLFRLND